MSIRKLEKYFSRKESSIRKATTILRLMDNLEQELYENYINEQIQIAINKESKKCQFSGICDWLIRIIDTAREED